MAERDSVIKSTKEGNKLSKAQKIIIIGAVVVAILLFIYSFIFMTPFSDLYQIDGAFSFWNLAKLGITEGEIAQYFPPDIHPEAYYISPFSGDKIGINLAYFTSFTRHELQVFNHWLFIFGFVSLLVSLVPLIYFSQKRKIYYKTNFVAIPAVAAFNLYVGIHMLVQLITNQMLVLSKVNEYHYVSAYQTHISNPGATEVIEYYHVTDSNPMFIIGYLIVALIIAFAIASCALAFFKYRHQKKQGKVDLSQVVINE